MTTIFVFNIGEDWTAVEGGEAFYTVNDSIIRELLEGSIKPNDLAKMNLAEYPLWLLDDEEPWADSGDLLAAARNMLAVLAEHSGKVPASLRVPLGDAERQMMQAVTKITREYDEAR
jgi:ABC-type transport system involved in cytochrome c biogenesis ATPase subunit